MEYSLTNHLISAKFNSKGAELISLKKTGQELEYIWKADPQVWGRHAPILFPIVGRLKNDQYSFNGKTYSLGQHGFARNMEFSIVNQGQEIIVFELKESEETLKVYPFRFSLQVTYALHENILTTKYEVKNRDEKLLYFSIGGHPGFTCPLLADEKRSDYYLEFEFDETAQSHILRNGTISSETKPAIVDKKIFIIDDLFDEDALIFKALKSEKVSLKNSNHQPILHFSFPKFPYLGIWSIGQTSPYVCIEPWYGIADNNDHDRELTRKEGIQSLPPTASFESEYTIEIV